ncbi:hypothetical protein PanWU01x14_106660 [Parasponia andersonii]|uniref:Uncharacterized protein n=1 Tax=Parasponia andersonii TaxID=3476 RepID=A0A2P5D0S5_PARAD|nr:hypothetical protein PanWU01x14_106660 [Parasponia andersonii]
MVELKSEKELERFGREEVWSRLQQAQVHAVTQACLSLKHSESRQGSVLPERRSPDPYIELPLSPLGFQSLAHRRPTKGPSDGIRW